MDAKELTDGLAYFTPIARNAGFIPGLQALLNESIREMEYGINTKAIESDKEITEFDDDEVNAILLACAAKNVASETVNNGTLDILLSFNSGTLPYLCCFTFVLTACVANSYAEGKPIKEVHIKMEGDDEAQVQQMKLAMDVGTQIIPAVLNETTVEIC